MSLLLIVVLPLALTIIGIMLLNRLNHLHDQPKYSRQIDTVEILAAEREANPHDPHDPHLQRAPVLKRQKSIVSRDDHHRRVDR